VELMVVTGIFMILSGVVLSTNARFGNLIILQNLAHDMALSVRQAQVYGIAVRRYQGVNFDVPYGIHFTQPAADALSTYELFGDVNLNGVYDAGETVTATTMSGGYRIVNICARDLGGIESCGLSQLNILFHRPEPDAVIRRAAGASLDDRARIVIESRSAEQSEVIVESSGQISVQ
jgi:hypothetical protein